MTKKSFAEIYFNDFYFNNNRLQRIAFFPISAGSKRFSPAKSGCVSGGSMEL